MIVVNFDLQISKSVRSTLLFRSKLALRLVAGLPVPKAPAVQAPPPINSHFQIRKSALSTCPSQLASPNILFGQLGTGVRVGTGVLVTDGVKVQVNAMYGEVEVFDFGK